MQEREHLPSPGQYIKPCFGGVESIVEFSFLSTYNILTKIASLAPFLLWCSYAFPLQQYRLPCIFLLLELQDIFMYNQVIFRQETMGGKVLNLHKCFMVPEENEARSAVHESEVLILLDTEDGITLDSTKW